MVVFVQAGNDAAETKTTKMRVVVDNIFVHKLTEVLTID